MRIVFTKKFLKVRISGATQEKNNEIKLEN